MNRLLVVLVAGAVSIGALAALPRSANATVPGAIGRIVFTASADHIMGEIYTRDFAGGPLKRLTSNTTQEADVAWSPDGSKITYGSVAGSTTQDIWIMNADGTGKKNLTNDTSVNMGAVWSPDGSKIAYASTNTSGGSWNIWVMNPDGSGRKNLTQSPSSELNYDPSWSPDGSRIAFSSLRSGQMGIYVMDADGTDVAPILVDVGVSNETPSWSPDGAKIAFETTDMGVTNIATMNADGSGFKKITDRPAPDLRPKWSPDGHHIMFVSNADGDFDLWMVDPDGSSLQHLTDHPGMELHGAWESVNRPPVAVDDGPFSVWRSGAIHSVSVLTNDHDPDGENLVVKLISIPNHASSFTLLPDGSFVYHHDGSTTVTDSFQYQAWDTRSSASNTATVTINVRSQERPTVGLVDPGTGVWRLRNRVEVMTEFYYGNPGDYPFVGDWDCNTTDTPGLYRQSDGYAYLRNSNTQGVADLTFFFGNPGDVPIAGDFNGNGCDTLSIYRPSEARFYIINQLGQDGGGLGAADYSFLFGDMGDKPVVGDWDGDGIDEVGLHRESSGFFYYRNTLSTGIAHGQFYFGDPGDRFVAGDWGIVDGDDTPGLFRPSNQVFYFRHDLTQGNADSQFTWTGAGSGWLPVAGDFNLN